ncbi:MAG: IS110 family transposase [Abitibacteriaceae bacterium]|nr:IS110 family transposase [Abditibacteriaceae bacterium]
MSRKTSPQVAVVNLAYIGIDVAKATLAIAQDGQVCQIQNTRCALKAWLKRVPPNSRIALEATSTHHLLVADLAYAAGHVVYVVNPKDARHYRLATGGRAKTDPADAQLLARYLEREHTELRPYVPHTPQQRRPWGLLKRRAKLVQAKGRIRQYLSGLSGFAAQAKAIFERIDALVDTIEQQMATLLQACPSQQQAWQRLQGVVGIGPLTATALVAALERGTFKDSDAFVAYCGLDPGANDSGQKSGKRKISKRGDALLRRLLYTAAMSDPARLCGSHSISATRAGAYLRCKC